MITKHTGLEVVERNMNPSIILIGLFIFAAGGVASPAPIDESHACFTCNTIVLGEACNNTQTCSPTQDVCISQISYMEDDVWLTRACAIRTICAHSEENNADECYWVDPASYGFEGKCSFCCSGNECNTDLPANFRSPFEKSEDHSDTGVSRKPRAIPKPGGTTRPKPGGTTSPKQGGTTRSKPFTAYPTNPTASKPSTTNPSATNPPPTKPPLTNPPATNPPIHCQQARQIRRQHSSHINNRQRMGRRMVTQAKVAVLTAPMRGVTHMTVKVANAMTHSL